ncbi:hypothetical protein BC936DRAFT_139406 [Jimgerdemannia flammicorona]|uniref:Uncharacterized protein n=1 Tax=Jimgerdemannia flammicorona TaxID=994334 RepID=A0A433BA53_9FUNG|nr:hypothetical protein BC936DRAFT_139406 [Jimgerdemannia flammicorona]
MRHIYTFVLLLFLLGIPTLYFTRESHSHRDLVDHEDLAIIRRPAEEGGAIMSRLGDPEIKAELGRSTWKARYTPQKYPPLILSSANASIMFELYPRKGEILFANRPTKPFLYTTAPPYHDGSLSPAPEPGRASGTLPVHLPALAALPVR